MNAAVRLSLRNTRSWRRGFATVSSTLRDRCSDFPTKDILRFREVPNVEEGHRWTLSNVRENSEALACGMLSLGLNPGETVAVVLPSSGEHAAVHYAVASTGGLVADAEGELTVDSLTSLLDVSKCSALIVDGSVETTQTVRSVLPELESRFVKGRPLDYYPCGLPTERFPQLKFVLHTGLQLLKDQNYHVLKGMHCMKDVLRRHAFAPPFDKIEASMSEATPMLQSYSLDSGKAVANGPALSHGEILARSEAARAKIGFTADEKVCLADDHDFALGHIACMHALAQLVVPAATADAAKTAEAFDAEGCNHQWAA